MKPALLPPVLLLPFLVQCTSPRGGNDPGLTLSTYYEVEGSGSVSDIKLPLLQSPALEKRWGKPRATVLPDGSYLLAYSSPRSDFESLRIFASPKRIDSYRPAAPTYDDLDFVNEKPVTVRREQRWRTLSILDRSIPYHLLNPGSGADAPEWSTATFSIERPGSPVASYRILASSNMEDGDKVALSYLETVTF